MMRLIFITTGVFLFSSLAHAQVAGGYFAGTTTNVPMASTTAPGIVQPDGSTCNIVSGLLACPGAWTIGTGGTGISYSGGPVIISGSGGVYAKFAPINVNEWALHARSNNTNLAVENAAGASLMEFNQSGAVGIGSLSPDAKLQIAGGDVGVDINHGYAIHDSGGTQREVVMLDGSNVLHLQNNPLGAAGTIAFNTLGSLGESMRITSGGNIGIGTTAPTSLLDVQSNGNAAKISSVGFGSGNFGGMIVGAARGSQVSPRATQFNDVLGYFTFTGYGATGFSSGGRAFLQAVSAENWTDTSQGTNLNFAVTPVGSTAALTAMSLLNNGNFGIGTAAPQTTLDIAGQARLLPVATSALPVCSATIKGAVAYVTDAAAPTYGANLTGGGSISKLVSCNGTNWQT